MPDSVTETLCTRCGLCCDGTLLDDVEITESESARLEAMRVEVDTDDPDCMPLPCSALNRTRCTIYRFRPATCRGFECKVLHETSNGSVSVEAALKIIATACRQAARVRELCRAMGVDTERRSLADAVAEAQAARNGRLQSGTADEELRYAWSRMKILSRRFI